MSDFVIMTKPVVILMPLSCANEINGLRMRMTKSAVIPLCHPDRPFPVIYQSPGRGRMRKGESPHTTYGTARRQAGRPIRCVWPRGPPSILVSASPDHSGQNDRR